MSDDLFAAPTKDELARAQAATKPAKQSDMFAPPSDRELKAATGGKLTDEQLKQSGGLTDSNILKGVKDFFAPGGASAAESVPVIGPLARRAGEGFRAVVDYATGNGKGSLGETYDAIRSANDAANAKFAEEHPGTATGRMILGSAGGLGLTIPGVGMPGVAGVATRMAGSAALAGADQGLRTGDLAKAGQAAALGGALQGGLELVPVVGRIGANAEETLGNAADKVQEFANERAVKAATGQNKAVLKQIAKTKGIDETGAALLDGDKPVVQFGSSVSKIRDRAAEAADQTWQKITNIYQQADAAAGGKAVQGQEIADAIRQRAAGIEDLPQNEATIASLNKTAEYFEKQGPMSLQRAQDLKNNFLFKLADPRTHALGTDGNNAIRSAITDTMGESLRRVDPALEQAWAQEMNRYGAYAVTAGAAGDRAVANLSNRFISPSDYAAGIAGTMLEHGRGGDLTEAGKGLLFGTIAMTHKLLRERGSSMAAASANNLAGILQTSPEVLGPAYGVLEKAAEQGPAALEAAHMLLLKNDPQYRKTVEPKAIQNGTPMVQPKSDTPLDAIRRRIGE